MLSELSAPVLMFNVPIQIYGHGRSIRSVGGECCGARVFQRCAGLSSFSEVVFAIAVSQHSRSRQRADARPLYFIRDSGILADASCTSMPTTSKPGEHVLQKIEWALIGSWVSWVRWLVFLEESGCRSSPSV